MVRVQVASNEPEGDRFRGGSLKLARGEGAGSIAVGQQAKEEFGGVGCSASWSIVGIDGREVKLGNHVDDEAGEMVRRQEVAQAHGLVERCLIVNGFECSTHEKSVAFPDRSGERFSPTNC